MNNRLKIQLSLILMIVSVCCIAQDRTKTKDNEADIYDNLYDIYVQVKKHRADSACVTLSDSMRTLAIRQGDKRAIAMSYAHPVSYYMNYGTEEQFFKSVEDLMKASEEAELWSFYYHALSQKSVYLLRQNRVAETIEMAEKMSDKAYAENNKNGIYVSHSILVNCYQILRLYDEGIRQAEKAIEAEQGLPDNKFGNSVSRLVELNMLKRDYEGTLSIIEKYYPLCENENVKVRMWEYRTQCYYWLGRTAEFNQSYSELQSMYDIYGETTGSKKDYLKILNLYVKGRHKEALSEASKMPLMGQSYIFSKMYKDAGDTEKLYQILLGLDAEWRSYHNMLYETDLKKYSLELDNHNLKLHEQEILEHQRTMRVYAVLCLFVVLLLFGGVLYWREQRSRKKLQKANSLLEEQKKQLEEQLVAVQEANMANNAKSAFLFNMSHDIRTPMNAIMGFSDLLEKEKNNPEKVSDYIHKIKSSGRFLLSLINDVLDMARIESGKMELDEECHDLLDVKDNVVDIFLEMAQNKNITLNRGNNVVHRYAMVDHMKVRQILLNVISNAIKYTPEGGTVTCTLEERPSDREGYATYVSTVTDTGIGMSPEYAKNIFDMFSRERNTTESKQEGTGLGMSIVKRLVDMMGGTIEVKTELGKGTTFVVSIPHKIAEAPEQFLQNELQKEKGLQFDSLHGKRILLAEDNDLNAEIAMALLEDSGFIIERAEDGVQCVMMVSDAESGYYDLILMDVQMPNMNGYEATRTIRQMQDATKANIPILAMTANAFEEDKKAALDAGMNGHVAKPIDMAKLMKCIMETIK